jgi:integrase
MGQALLGAKSPFVSNRTAERIARFARMVERAGRKAKLTFKVHPHMHGHACGYALANKGHDTRAESVVVFFADTRSGFLI